MMMASSFSLLPPFAEIGFEEPGALEWEETRQSLWSLDTVMQLATEMELMREAVLTVSPKSLKRGHDRPAAAQSRHLLV